MNIMNYKEANDYFYGFKNHFWDLGLDNIKGFMKRMDNPQNKVKIIHIAGTNGKGSVSAFVSEILIEAGYRVGRYNSPVVFERLENITINNEMITEEAFAKQVQLLKPVMEEMNKEGKLPTVFELETALAYNYFATENCDFAVIECGLGGEKDATNITNAKVLSVLTSIGLDHMGYLGNTLEEITEAKAGIIHKDIPVVTICQENVVNGTIRRIATEKDAPYIEVQKTDICVKEADFCDQKFAYKAEEYQINLLGLNQIENACEAIACMEILNDRRIGKVTKEQIREGLKKTFVKGRFQIIRRENPMVIIDGAHNPDAARRLRENIQCYLKNYNIIFLMGIFEDKDYRRVVECTCDLADNIYAVKADSQRALPAEKLIECIRSYGKNAVYTASISDAVNMAVLNAKELTAVNGRKSAVVCFGSLSYLKYVAELFG